MSKNADLPQGPSTGESCVFFPFSFLNATQLPGGLSR